MLPFRYFYLLISNRVTCHGWLAGWLAGRLSSRYGDPKALVRVRVCVCVKENFYPSGAA